ncbi:hypothetical protein JKP88DRAFT_350272 [Tribonema minus]|uniref:DUF72 domain-containing protein n=1 Tax=Tribonema minus TaxID=303371 RepID=A0A836CAB8_9STRA|nr:hypothetical protein JKP88DRAFT_350272 [Tribonema minus]
MKESSADELKYYGSVLPSCEINSTFYGLPRTETCAKWRNAVPEQFKFSMKVSKSITHDARLRGIEDAWQAFYARAAEGLQHKLGPCLFQLPPSLTKDMTRLQDLCQLVQDVSPQAQIAMEFRSATWFCEDVFQLLRARNWALVENFSPDGSICTCDEQTADWTYSRWHGVIDARGHGTDFPDDELRRYAEKAAARARAGARAQYVFFGNDLDATAVRNAQTLISATKKPSSVKPSSGSAKKKGNGSGKKGASSAGSGASQPTMKAFFNSVS